VIPGGFTGVDIFFVISGILYKGLKANGGAGRMLKCLGKSKKITVVLSIPTGERGNLPQCFPPFTFDRLLPPLAFFSELTVQ
jgi:hypothetical protein